MRQGGEKGSGVLHGGADRGRVSSILRQSPNVPYKDQGEGSSSKLAHVGLLAIVDYSQNSTNSYILRRHCRSYSVNICSVGHFRL